MNYNPFVTTVANCPFLTGNKMLIIRFMEDKIRIVWNIQEEYYSGMNFLSPSSHLNFSNERT